MTPRIEGTEGVKGATGTQGASEEFGNLVLDGIDRLEGVQAKSDGLAVKAATGDLGAIHQYTLAASEAAVTTQLTVAVRNKAVEAFTEIMRMPV
jgi:flagellar hook-basal body complex protein FliE